jgi:hypothetical protein
MMGLGRLWEMSLFRQVLNYDSDWTSRRPRV